MTVCASCHGTGHVCEEHPDRPWADMCCGFRDADGRCPHGGCACGAGAPCACCRIIEPGGSILDAFVPGPRMAPA